MDHGLNIRRSIKEPTMISIEEKYDMIDLYRRGVSISEIARQTGSDDFVDIPFARPCAKWSRASRSKPRKKQSKTQVRAEDRYLCWVSETADERRGV